MNKLSLLVVLVTCFYSGLASRVSFDNGNFNASWTYNRDTDELYFEVDVKTSGWVGFGFTFTPENMTNYDVIIGGQTDLGQSYFNDFFSYGLVKPQLDSKQSYILDRATEQYGITSLRFHRPRNTNDSQDIQFNVTTRVFLVWAYQDLDDASNPRMFSMHTHRNHTKESHLIVVATNPTIFTNRVTHEPTTRRSIPTTVKFTKAKSSGPHQCVSFITFFVVTILSILLEKSN